MRLGEYLKWIADVHLPHELWQWQMEPPRNSERPHAHAYFQTPLAHSLPHKLDVYEDDLSRAALPFRKMLDPG